MAIPYSSTKCVPGAVPRMQRHCPTLHQGGYRVPERDNEDIQCAGKGATGRRNDVSKDLLTTVWKPEQTALSPNLQASVEAVDSQFQHTSTVNLGRRSVTFPEGVHALLLPGFIPAKLSLLPWTGTVSPPPPPTTACCTLVVSTSRYTALPATPRSLTTPDLYLHPTPRQPLITQNCPAVKC